MAHPFNFVFSSSAGYRVPLFLVLIPLVFFTSSCAQEDLPAATPRAIPTSSPSLLSKAQRHALNGDFETAVELFRRASKQDTKDRNARVGLAQVLLRSGRKEEAITVCRDGLAQDSTALPLYNILALTYAGEGRYALAIEALTTALRQRPDYALGHINLGRIHTKLGQYKQAEPHLQKAVALEADNPLARRRLAELYLSDARPKLAAEEFALALQFDAESETLHFFLGQALEASGRSDEALNHFIQARELDPSFADAHYRTALLARRQDNALLAQEAIAAFRRLQQIGDGDANVLKQLNQLRAAVIDYPEEAMHHYDLARFLAAHGFATEALNRFARVLQKRPGDFRAMNNIGNILLEQKKPEAALKFYLKVIAQSPSFAPAHMNAGNASMLLERPAQAVVHYGKASELAPQAPMTWYNLARGHSALKNHAAADSALTRGRRQSQPNEAMRQAYEKLHQQVISYQ